MRDYETISAAVTAAETGHLVLSTLHTIGAAQTIDRIIDVCPAGAQNQIRGQLAAVLRGVITQQLLPLGGRAGALRRDRNSRRHRRRGEPDPRRQVLPDPQRAAIGCGAGHAQPERRFGAACRLGRITRDTALRCATDKSDLENYL